MAKKKRKLTYWERRAVEQENKVTDGLQPMENKVIKAYNDANKYLTKEVKSIYDRYLDKSDFNEAEVKAILNTNIPASNIAELSALVRTIKDPSIKKRTQDYLTGLAVKSRITRLEELKAKAYIVSKKVADVQLTNQTDYYIDVIQEAYNRGTAEAVIGKMERNYRLIDDGKFPTYIFDDDKGNEVYRLIDDKKYPTYVFNDDKAYIEITDVKTENVVKRINVTNDLPIKEFKELSTKQVRNILDTRWVGANYSERIWKDTDLLAKKLQEMFAVEALTGMSESDMAKMLQKQFNVSSGIARRLIRTEANYMNNQAKLKGWQNNGVEEYQIIAVLDLRTSLTCQHEDRKIYKIKDAEVGVNYPPYHAWCRSVAIAHFKGVAISGIRTAINPVTKKAFNLQLSDTYRQWEKKIIAQTSKKDVALQKKKVINFNQDNDQYKRYKQKLGTEGTDMPKTLADFQDVKYNKNVEYERLKKLYRNHSKTG